MMGKGFDPTTSGILFVPVPPSGLLVSPHIVYWVTVRPPQMWFLGFISLQVGFFFSKIPSQVSVRVKSHKGEFCFWVKSRYNQEPDTPFFFPHILATWTLLATFTLNRVS